MEELLEWINHLNETTHVDIKTSEMSDDSFWFLDTRTGYIKNRNNSFFSIAGIKGNVNNKEIQQPIIIQNEIGYLGIICKEFEGVTKYLMQAKIEPGNINCVQISPTIQATKSNFTQKHGGKKPDYLDFFINANEYQIIADQIQSEQSSRFYKKRNRNMIIKVTGDVEVLPRFRWMTLCEIKEIMKYRNLVNMDTRTVLSCLPLVDVNASDIDCQFNYLSEEFKKSIHSIEYIDEITSIYHKINNYKMFNYNEAKIVSLYELDNWNVSNLGVSCKSDFPYEVNIYDIEIEGREVTKWQQPLFKANGIALFGLIRTIINGEYKYLVKLSPEIGNFDAMEIGPTIQKEYGETYQEDAIEVLFKDRIDRNISVSFDSILSEEGGRFYHEENRNIILDVEYEDLKELPLEYSLLSYRALNHLNLVNNCLNIQLRNLLSTMEVC
ncbi:NDP-hexose 2,3-dehydratase family protein [Tannockella kyphosi]|uniref:NDP-hexose 2,3-dehydratase family protein n=1 Tax=Tannockella kyphosi TaxID=2899121 RepID=UPI0020128739|nr:NDP-hexose 2,3-dehydratase family protein [Tannockella kyphosi]